jgi:hypothetical protein
VLPSLVLVPLILASMAYIEGSALLPDEVVSGDEIRPASGRFGKVALVSAAALMAVVATAVATAAYTTKVMIGSTGLIQEQDEMTVVKPAYENCASKPKDDCLIPRCCGQSGYNCFKVKGNKGRCMRECTSGGSNGTCEGVAPHMSQVVEHPGLSLFCFAVYTKNTGSEKPSSELTLLQGQYERGVSIFSCAEWSVYSDVVVPLGGNDVTKQVFDVKKDWHLMKRKIQGTWINTGMFVQVWKAIQDEGHYKNHNWVIKADADAVFFPHKLEKVLTPVGVPSQGVYMENCKFVDWGYFGNLEVFSKQAFETLVLSVDECYDALPWKVGVKDGKWGPMGEDLFAQKCMDMKNVAKAEMFELTTDGACESDRPEGQRKNKKWEPTCAGTSTPSIHPFKKPDMYFKCLEEAKDAMP